MVIVVVAGVVVVVVVVVLLLVLVSVLLLLMSSLLPLVCCRWCVAVGMLPLVLLLFSSLYRTLIFVSISSLRHPLVMQLWRCGVRCPGKALIDIHTVSVGGGFVVVVLLLLLVLVGGGRATAVVTY